MKIGFIQEPTEAERLFQLAAEENFMLKQSLNDSQHELIATQQKLAKAKEQLAQFGVDVSQFEFETNTRLDSHDTDITDAQEAIGETVELIGDNSTDIEDLQLAVAEVIEMIS